MRLRIALCLTLLQFFGLLLIQRIDSFPAAAQAGPPLPLLLNEVEAWCDHGCGAVYSDLPGGYLRVIINEFNGSLEGACETVTISADVEGWAFAKAEYGSESGQVIAIADARARPETIVCELVVRRIE